MLGLIFYSQDGVARVFSYNDNWFTTYLRGTGGLSHVGENAYDDTTGSNTQFNDEVMYNFSGELGLAFQFGEAVTLRIGAEGLQAKNIKANGVLASNPNNYIDVDSRVLSFSPTLTVEYNYAAVGYARLYVLAATGYSTVNVTNENTLNSGAATYYSYAGVNPYKETWAGDPTFSYQAGTGIEYFAFDNVTMSLDVGWRILHVKEFEYKDTMTVIRGAASTNVTKGAIVRDNGGHPVDLDLGGFFVGVMFKFYIPPLR